MAEGDYVVPGSSGGGIRVVHVHALRKDVVEAGISSVSGLGNVPTGISVWRAAMKAPVNQYGEMIVRVTGSYSTQQQLAEYDPPEIIDPNDPKWGYGTLDITRSHRVVRQQFLDTIYPVRLGGGGSGAGEENHLPGDDSDYNNTFLRVMAEATGFNWDRIDTVQFFI